MHDYYETLQVSANARTRDEDSSRVSSPREALPPEVDTGNAGGFYLIHEAYRRRWRNPEQRAQYDSARQRQRRTPGGSHPKPSRRMTSRHDAVVRLTVLEALYAQRRREPGHPGIPSWLWGPRSAVRLTIWYLVQKKLVAQTIIATALRPRARTISSRTFWRICRCAPCCAIVSLKTAPVWSSCLCVNGKSIAAAGLTAPEKVRPRPEILTARGGWDRRHAPEIRRKCHSPFCGFEESARRLRTSLAARWRSAHTSARFRARFKWNWFGLERFETPSFQRQRPSWPSIERCKNPRDRRPQSSWCGWLRIQCGAGPASPGRRAPRAQGSFGQDACSQSRPSSSGFRKSDRHERRLRKEKNLVVFEPNPQNACCEAQLDRPAGSG